MVGKDFYFVTKEYVPVLFERLDYAEEFSLSRRVPSLSWAQLPTVEGYRLSLLGYLVGND